MGTFVRVMGRALVQSGHQVRVVGIYPPDCGFPDYEQDRGVRVWRLRRPAFAYGWLVGRYRLYKLVKRWINQGHVDVVDAHDPEGWFAGWPRTPVPLVIRAGGSFSYFSHELGQPLSPSLFRIERSAYRRADAWIAKSNYIGEVTRRLFDLRHGPDAVLYNPVDLPEQVRPFESRHPDKVIFTGTLTAKKGIIPLIDAWPKVKETCPKAELHFYGKEGRAPTGAPMTEYLRARLPQALVGSVHFHGHVQRDVLYGALGSARVAVFPSFSEGFAWAPLESMAAGCPTIYTCLGSGSELIVDGRDGILVDPNQPVQIADAIAKVLRDDQAARTLSAAGRDRITEAFTLEKLLPFNESFYSDVIARFHRRATTRPTEMAQRAKPAGRS